MTIKEEERPHPILARPHEFSIIGLSIDADPESPLGPTLDLTLKRGQEIRRLRFRGVRELTIDNGFPNSSGLQILDVRHRQLDAIGVRVSNSEPIGGCPLFWALDVAEIS